MAVQFETSENLIDLLVGQSLYSNPDVAMRELLQNAEDACFLQSLTDTAFSPEIVVSYSLNANWVEISDNGLGMDAEVFQQSFATIGASKTNSPKLQALLERAGTGARPIGQFGIGILSCFGVADCVEIRSRADGEEPVSVRISDRRKQFEILSDHRETRGTSLRLYLKVGGPMQAVAVPAAISRYVRHARHIWLHETDTDRRTIVPEQWLLDQWRDGSEISSSLIDAGHLQLSDAWDNIGLGFDVQIVLSNGGFLVEQSNPVLPPFTLGVRGEANAKPGALTILMNREGFQQDERWQEFVGELLTKYRLCVENKLNNWLELDFLNLEFDHIRAIQRAVFLLLRTQAGALVGTDNVERARRLLPEVMLLSGGKVGKIDRLLAIAKQHPPLYVARSDTSQPVKRSFSDRGQNLEFTETVQSLELRVSLLALNGFAVVQTEKHDYNISNGSNNHSAHIHDADVLAEYCGQKEIAIASVSDAPAAHTQIGSSSDAEAITNLFELPSVLKIQSVESMTSAIIADFNGYILNPKNPEIRRILEIMPSAVGNPIRKSLLSIYFALSTYRVSEARQSVFDIITDPDFDYKARRVTGRYFYQYLEERVKSLLSDENAESEESE